MRGITEEELDLTGTLGLDFVNTVVRTRTGSVDLLDTPESFVEWIRRVGDARLEELLPQDLPGLRTATREALRLRDALVVLFRWRGDPSAESHASTARRTAVLTGPAARSFDAPAVDSTTSGAVWRFTVDRALGAALGSYRLAGAPAGTQSTTDAGLGVQTVFQPNGPLTILTPIALSAIEVARDADPGRLRECDADDCVRWFVDSSRGGRRRWCSMARCGNRAKAARFRKRRASGG